MSCWWVALVSLPPMSMSMLLLLYGYMYLHRHWKASGFFFLYLLTLISFLFIQMSAAASCILAFSVCVCVFVYLCAVWIVTVCLRDSVGFFRCFLSFYFIPLRCFILHAASLYFIFYNVATITHTHTYTHKHIGREYMFAISLLLLSPTRAVKGIRHTHTHRSAVKG